MVLVEGKVMVLVLIMNYSFNEDHFIRVKFFSITFSRRHAEFIFEIPNSRIITSLYCSLMHKQSLKTAVHQSVSQRHRSGSFCSISL